MDNEETLPYLFCIYNRALINFRNAQVNESVTFYDKQNFTAYITPSHRFRYGNDPHFIYRLANYALYGEESDLLSNSEYVEDMSMDEFVCIDESNVEIDADTYLESKNISYDYVSCGCTEFARWL